VFREDDKTAAPIGDFDSYGVDGFRQRMSARFAQTDKQQTGMCARRELANIGEI